MSEKRRKSDEILERGRMFGSIAKDEPEIWEWLEKEALMTGRKKHELVADYIARAIIEREVIARGLTMEQLLAAWDLKDRLETMLMRKTLMLGTQIFTTLLNQVGEMVATIRESQEASINQIVEESKKKDIEFQLKKTQVQMMTALLNSMIMPILSQLKIGTTPVTTAPQPQKTEKKARAIIID